MNSKLITCQPLVLVTQVKGASCFPLAAVAVASLVERVSSEEAKYVVNGIGAHSDYNLSVRIQSSTESNTHLRRCICIKNHTY